jgi:large subunit ribosomal protein L24
MQAKRLKKGDMVKVISGKEKGKTGKILKTIREKNQIIVEKLNVVKRHKRPDAKGKGKKDRSTSPKSCMSVTNVMSGSG